MIRIDLKDFLDDQSEYNSITFRSQLNISDFAYSRKLNTQYYNSANYNYNTKVSHPLGW